MPSRRGRKQKRSQLEKQRNRVRGLIGASRSTAVSINVGSKGKDKRARAGEFQRSLAALLVTTREVLAANQFGSFLSWMEQQTTSQVHSFSQFGALNSEMLRVALNARPLPLEKELLWTSLRLASHGAQIGGFVQAREKLENLYWGGDWPSIKSHLDEMQASFGKSLWLLECRIALEQEFVGLEAQKRIPRQERKLHSRGLAAYVSHHVSARNEPTTVLSRHIEEMSERLEKLQEAEGLKSFLQFKFLGTDQVTDHAAASALLFSQGLSEIDFYETFIAIGETLVARNELDPELRSVLIGCLERITSIGDGRIGSLLALVSGTPLLRPLTNFDGQMAPRAAMRVLHKDPRNVRVAMLIAGYLQNVRKPHGDARHRRPWNQIIRLTASVLRFDEAFDSDFDTIRKFLINHRFLATFASYSHLLASHTEVVPPLVARARKRAVATSTSLNFDWKAFGQAGSSLPALSGAESSHPRWVEILRELARLREFIECGDMLNSLQCVSDLHLLRRVPLSLLPLREWLSPMRWRQLKRFRSYLALPIALHLCWRATDSDLAVTNLRFSYDEFLDEHNVGSPVELASVREKFAKHELVYFMRNICIPGVIDMSRRLKSSRDVELERRNICATLRDLDPANQHLHDAEIVLISHALSLEEGKTIVDSSRVHVDTQAVKSWAVRELESTFRRYCALVEAGVGVAENLDVLLRNARQLPQLLDVPESEADTLLIDMLMSMRDKFLLDPQHGLDSYLSRRVRHHSMTGYLRGPVEEAKLITSRNSETGRYVENWHWLSKLQRNGDNGRAAVLRSLEQFAEEFDGVVLRLKTELFHVVSKEHAKGIFGIPVSAPMIHLVRSAVQVDMVLESFCQICFSVFWSSLDGSLKMAQQQLQVQTKRDLSGALHRLRASLRKSVTDKEAYDEVSLEIGRAAESVQREIDRMSEWFVRREAQFSTNLYSFDKALDIAIASALASHRPFDPQLEKRVSCSDYHIRSGDLVVIAEIVLTALGNVKDHADVGERPEVHVAVSLNEAKDLVTIRIVNKVGGRRSRLQRRSGSTQSERKSMMAPILRESDPRARAG